MKPENLLLRPPTSAQKCTLGCPILDACLNGGIPCDSLTEIVAESSSGKTQLCLQLSLSAQLPTSHGGLGASCLYLHSEFPFPFRRLHHLSLSFQSLHPQIFAHNPCDYIYVQSVHSADQLFDIMPKIESFLLNSNTLLPVRLIVIDSIAALFRSEYENNPSDLRRRSSMFFKISGKLKELARRFSLAVVITNQVVDFVGGCGEGLSGLRVGNLGSLWSSGRRICAALGLGWANCVNSRLFLSREDNEIGLAEGGGEEGRFARRQTRRRLHVVFAPHLPASSCEFMIKKEGVFGIENNGEFSCR